MIPPSPTNHETNRKGECKTLRVAIIDRCVPHYREALYNELMASNRASYHIIAAKQPIEVMHTVSPPPHWPWTDAPCRRIPGSGNRSVWQWGAIKAGFSPKFDVILMMANPRDPGLWFCALGARLTGKRLLMWTHGSKHPDRHPSIIRRLWHNLAHALLFYGQSGQSIAIKNGTPPFKCHVVFNSLDYDQQKSFRTSILPDQSKILRRKLFGDENIPVIICISRFHARKQIDILLNAHHILKIQKQQVHLLLVGDGDQMEPLRKLAEKNQTLEQTIFYGPCYDEPETASLLMAADLCVIPGDIGLSAMHALAYGIPVITHDDPTSHGPEFESIIPELTGEFFHKDDAEHLAIIMSNWLFPKPRKLAVSQYCINIIEQHYTPERQAIAMERAILGLPPLHVQPFGQHTPKSS